MIYGTKLCFCSHTAFECKPHLSEHTQALSYKPAFLAKTGWKTNFGITMLLCVTAKQHFFIQTTTNNVKWSRLSEEMQKREDSTKNRKTGTCAMRWPVRLVWWGYPVEGLAAVSFLSTACSLHIPFHWQRMGTISYSWFSEGFCGR